MEDKQISMEEKHISPESYWNLVWRKFKLNKPGLIGSFLVMILLSLAVFSDFFSPSDPNGLYMTLTFRPPQRVRFIHEGQLSRPFVYPQVSEWSFETMTGTWRDDTSRKFYIRFFIQGYEYSIFGIRSNLHLFGTSEGEHFFALGSDKMGRDMWARMCIGSRISMTMALFGTLISIFIGACFGTISGYFGGKIDVLMQRFTEFMQSFPQLPLWMALVAIVPRHWNQMTIFVIMALIFALLSWPVLSRELRGKVISMAGSDMILAAKEMGASHRRIIFKHLFPNNFSHIIVVMTLTIPSICLAESFLSFLGIGIQDPMVSWGLLMRDAQTIETLGGRPWIMFPVLMIVATVLGFNFLGDGLRDGADPYTRH